MKEKKIPMRRCALSRVQHPKKDMIRVVYNKENEISVDLTGKKNGRGAYLLLDVDSVQLARQRKVFERAFSITDIEYIYDELEVILNDK